MRRRHRLARCAAVLFGASAIVLGSKPQAATFVVTSALDSGPGTFRQALADALNQEGEDTIAFSGVTGQITLTNSVGGLSNVTIVGPGAGELTIHFGFQAPVADDRPSLTIPAGVSARISGLRLTRRPARVDNLQGGLIANAGTMILEDCELVDSEIKSFPFPEGLGREEARGAAIYSSGSLIVSGCTIANNKAQANADPNPSPHGAGASGGGVYLASGSAFITNTTFSGNRATSASVPELHVDGKGGAICVAGGSLRLLNCTLANNSAGVGEAIYRTGGSVQIYNTVVTDEITGVAVSGLNNYVTNATLAQAGLGALQDNGGPTRTHALLPDCPAIDRALDSIAPTRDQRGAIRPQGRHCDIGAFELEGVPELCLLDLFADGAGTVTVDPDLTAFPRYSEVSLRAMGNEDSEFVAWSGDATGSANPLALTMDGDKRIVARFRAAPATVTNAPGATNLVVNTNGWGPGSFRQAIRDLNASRGGTIRFSGNLGTIHSPMGLPPLEADVRILGPGNSNLVLVLPNGVPGLVVNSGVTSLISGLVIRSAQSDARWGGAISNAGTLELRQTHFQDCRAFKGGAICNRGRLEANECVFAQGSATYGGAIYNQGELRVANSAFLENSVAARQQETLAGGGAVYQDGGTAQFVRTWFLNNRAAGYTGSFASQSTLPGGSGKGGAIYLAAGSVDMVDSLVCSNRTSGGHGTWFVYEGYSGAGSGGDALGSGMFVQAGQLTLTNCSIVQNRGIGGSTPYGGRGPGSSQASGGGIYVQEGQVFAQNCTVSDNEVWSGGAESGGVDGRGGAVTVYNGFGRLENCTITANRAFGGHFVGFSVTNLGRGLGGGLFVYTNSSLHPALTLANTIVAGNYGTWHGTNDAVAADVFGKGVSQGYNLFGAIIHFTNLVGSDLLGVDPRLGPLADNGGPTPTHALLADSPAIDAGGPSSVAFDQRAQPRPLDDPGVPNRSGGNGTDIGSVEASHILRFTGLVRAGTEVVAMFTTRSDNNYRLQQAAEVNGPWETLPGLLPGTGGIVRATIAGFDSAARKFYRVLAE